MILIAVSRPRRTIFKLNKESYLNMYGAPDLSEVRFSSQTLIQGLIAQGITRPGDVPELVKALKENAVVPAFQDRILEAPYNEERVRHVATFVKSTYERMKLP